MASAPVGEIPVLITGDWSGLEKNLDAATSAAQEGAAKIAASFTAAADPAKSLDEQLAALYAQGMTAAQALEVLGGSTDGVQANLELLTAQATDAAGAVGDAGEAFATAGDNAGVAGEKIDGEVVPALEHVHESAGHAESGVHTLVDAFTEITGIALTFEALKEAAEETVTAFGNEQAATIALTASLKGNKEEAGEMIEKAKDLADALGQSNSATIQATQSLLAFGIPAEDVRGVLIGMGTAALAANAPLETISQRFTSMAASGNLMNRGLVSLRLTLADVATAMDMTGAPAADVKEAFKELGDTAQRAGVLAAAELTKFPTLANDAADSVNNAWNRVKNATENAFVEIGKQLGGFGALVTPIIDAIKGIETGFIALLIPVKVAVDAVIAGGGIILETLTGLGKAALETAQGNFAEAAADISDALARAKSYASGFATNVKTDWSDSAKAISAIWTASMEDVSKGAQIPKPDIDNLTASQKLLNQAVKDLNAGAKLLGDIWRATLPPMTDVAQAEANLVAAQNQQKQSAEDLLKAQGDLDFAVNALKPNIRDVTAATVAQQAAYKDAESATKNVAEAQKQLTAAKKDAATVSKDLLGVDTDYATMLRTLGAGSVTSYAQAVTNLATAKSKYQAAASAELAIGAQLDALYSAGKQGTSEYATAQGALATAKNATAEAAKGEKQAQTDLTGAQTEQKAATAALLQSETDLSNLYKDNLSGTLPSLIDSLNSVRDAKVRVQQAAIDEKNAQVALSAAEKGGITDTAQLKILTDNLTTAHKNLASQQTQLNTATSTLGKNYKITGDAVVVLTGATNDATLANQNADAAFLTLGLDSVASLQATADKATQAYNTITTATTVSVARRRQATIAWLTDEQNLYRAQGSNISLDQQQMLDTLIAQQTLYVQNTKLQMVDWRQAWATAIVGIDNSITNDLEQGLDGIIAGTTSVSAAFKKMGLDIVNQVVNVIMAQAIKPLLSGLNDILGSIINMFGVGGAGGGVMNVGIDTLDKTISAGVTDISSVLTTATTDMTTAVSTAATDMSQAASSAASSVGSAASSAVSSVGSAISGIMGAIGSIIGAVAGIIGDIETAKTNDILKAMEKETARMAIYLGDHGVDSILGQSYLIQSAVNYGPLVKASQSLLDKFSYFSVEALKSLGHVDSQTYWSMQKLDDIDSKTGKGSGGNVNVSGADLTYLVQGLGNINNTLQYDVGLGPWERTAIQNINNGIVACAGWLQGIAGYLAIANSSGGGATVTALNAVATYVGANFTALETWLFNALGKTMALPALPAPVAIPAALGGATGTGGVTVQVNTTLNGSVVGQNGMNQLTNTIGNALVGRLRNAGLKY